MRVTLPCSCAEEEHEVDVQPEYYLNRLGWDGFGAGDALPCGRIGTKDDEERIYEQITYRPELED